MDFTSRKKEGIFDTNLSTNISDLSSLIERNEENLKNLNSYLVSSPTLANNISLSGFRCDIYDTFRVLSSSRNLVGYFVNSSIALKAIPALFVQGLEMEVLHNKLTPRGIENYRSKLDLTSKEILNIWESLTGIVLDSLNSQLDILQMVVERSIEGFDKLCIKNLIEDYKKIYNLDNHESAILGDGSFFPKLFKLTSMISPLSSDGFPLIILPYELYVKILSSRENEKNDLEKFKHIIIKKDLKDFNLDPNELILTWCSEKNPAYILGISDIFTINLSNNSICTIIDGGILDESKFAHIRLLG